MWKNVANVASIISILSAIFSFWQAYRAGKKKKETEKIKDLLINKFNVYIDSKLLSRICTIKEELNKNRKKPFNANPLMIGQKLNNSVSLLLSDIRGQQIYEKAEVKKMVNKAEKILKSLNAQDFSNQISDLIGCLSDIARYIDIEQRGT